MIAIIKKIRARFVIMQNSILAALQLRPHVLTTEETVSLIIDKKISVSRYGDGEMAVILGGHNGFQAKNSYLQLRLIEILKSDAKNHAVAIPNIFESLDYLKPESQEFWKGNLRITLKSWLHYTKRDKNYLDSLFTRFYNAQANKNNCSETISLIQKIWDKKDVLIIEGRGTRMGYNNDLLNNASSIKRILAPSKNAIQNYEEILHTALTHSTPDQIILIALGQTATVLAYDLAQENRWAIDIGHIDIEYEWFKAKATGKIAIPNKDVNEVQAFITEELTDASYQKQVLAEIPCMKKEINT